MTTGQDIVRSAMKYAGVPYFEGNPQGTPSEGLQGFDCSGIVQRAMADLGVQISRTTQTQLADARSGKSGVDIGTNVSQAQPGDIIHYPGHEEVYLGGGQEWGEHTYGVPTGPDRVGSAGPIVGIVRYATGGPGVESAGFNLPLVPGVDYGDNFFDQGDTGGTTVNPRLLAERGVTGAIEAVPWPKVALYSGGGLCIVIGIAMMFPRGAARAVAPMLVKKYDNQQ